MPNVSVQVFPNGYPTHTHSRGPHGTPMRHLPISNFCRHEITVAQKTLPRIGTQKGRVNGIAAGFDKVYSSAQFKGIKF